MFSRWLDYGEPVNWLAPLNNRGLVNWWKVLPQRYGGQRWLDLVKRNHGVLTNMGASSASSGWSMQKPPGSHGSLVFDGVDDAVSIPTPNPSTVYSWSMWMKSFDTPGSGITQPFVNGITSNSYGFSWDHDAGAFRQAAYQFDGATFYAAAIVTALAGFVWYWIGTTYDGANLRIYLNGQLEATTASAVAITPVGSLTLGSSGSNPWPGWIDDVRLYNRALSTSEMQVAYQHSRQGYAEELRYRSMDFVAVVAAATRSLPPRRRTWRVWRRAA